jgi:electron transport complex protein RnfB
MLSVLIIAGIALILGALLGAAAANLREDKDAMVERVHDLLPHTQCGQCGFPGCRPYAQAVAEGKAAITLCPPGGAALVKNLAELLGEQPQSAPIKPAARVAVIDEARCVGCALCLPACPVDAIVGAPRHMHTVISAACTGCELCLPPCPVDCISIQAVNDALPAWRAIPIEQQRRAAQPPQHKAAA